MSYARQMLDTYPRALTVDASMLAAVIDAITDCAQACITDTDADLGEQNPDRDDQVHPAVPGLRRRLHRHRRGHQRPAGYDADVTKPLLEACVAICNSCGEECERHAGCTSTAGSAPRPAGAASRPAASPWTP